LKREAASIAAPPLANKKKRRPDEGAAFASKQERC
jgi:hypothetical protein